MTPPEPCPMSNTTDDLNLLRSLAALMGWHLKKRVYNRQKVWFAGPADEGSQGPGDVQIWPTNRQISFLPVWRPLDSMDDAMLIVEHLRARKDGDRYWCEMRTPWMDGDQDYRAGFSLWGCTGWNGRPDYSASAPSLSRAICEAAVLVCGRGAGE